MDRPPPAWLVVILSFVAITVCTIVLTSFTPTVAHAQDNFSCASVSEIPLVECEALVAIYNANPDSRLHDGDWLTFVATCRGTCIYNTPPRKFAPN